MYTTVLDYTTHDPDELRLQDDEFVNRLINSVEQGRLDELVSSFQISEFEPEWPWIQHITPRDRFIEYFAQ